MIKRIKKIYQKIIFHLIETTGSLEKYSDHVNIDDGLIDKGIAIRFDNEKGIEDRIYVSIGKRGLIGANFIFESPKGKVTIGDNVHIGNATFISRSSITVGNDVTMAWGIVIYDHDSHSLSWEYRKNDNHQSYSDYINYNGNSIINKDWNNVVTKPIFIEDKVWIGFDVTILKGVTIGEGSVVGAKSVVTRDVPPWTVVAGNPARIIKNLTLENE